MRDETQIDLYAAGAMNRKYDEACKRVFKNREMIAPILKMVVPEYKDCTVEKVIRCIDEETIKDIPIEDVPVQVEGLPTELSSVTDKLIRYDVHFKSVNPKLSDGQIFVHLHIDLELQNDYRPHSPSYPVIKRALYYAARELSGQLGHLTEATDYSELEKVYSIWICNENIPPELRDTATQYVIQKKDLIGKTQESEEEFDLINVIMIRRGGEGREKIFDFLNAVFHAEVKKLESYTVLENKKVEEEVRIMTGLGASIMERGIKQGLEQGLERGLEQGLERGLEQGIKKERSSVIEKMLGNGLSTEEIILYTGYTREDVLRTESQLQSEEVPEHGRTGRRPQHRR